MNQDLPSEITSRKKGTWGNKHAFQSLLNKHTHQVTPLAIVEMLPFASV